MQASWQQGSATRRGSPSKTSTDRQLTPLKAKKEGWLRTDSPVFDSPQPAIGSPRRASNRRPAVNQRGHLLPGLRKHPEPSFGSLQRKPGSHRPLEPGSHRPLELTFCDQLFEAQWPHLDGEIHVPDKPERRAVDNTMRPQKAASTRLPRASHTLVDDYAAQEKLRRQMVMGLGSGCRGGNTSKNSPAASGSQRPRTSFRSPGAPGGMINEAVGSHTPPRTMQEEAPWVHPGREYGHVSGGRDDGFMAGRNVAGKAASSSSLERRRSSSVMSSSPAASRAQSPPSPDDDAIFSNQQCRLLTPLVLAKEEEPFSASLRRSQSTDPHGRWRGVANRPKPNDSLPRLVGTVDAWVQLSPESVDRLAGVGQQGEKKKKKNSIVAEAKPVIVVVDGGEKKTNAAIVENWVVGTTLRRMF